jgi:hypothetical protein
MERRLAEVYSSRLFYLNIIWLNQLLVGYEILASLCRLYIMLVYDPGESFNVFFKQREARSCPYSYHEYKGMHHALSFYTWSALVIVMLAVVLLNVSTGSDVMAMVP